MGLTSAGTWPRDLLQRAGRRRRGGRQSAPVHQSSCPLPPKTTAPRLAKGRGHTAQAPYRGLSRARATPGGKLAFADYLAQPNGQLHRLPIDYFTKATGTAAQRAAELRRRFVEPIIENQLETLTNAIAAWSYQHRRLPPRSALRLGGARRVTRAGQRCVDPPAPEERHRKLGLALPRLFGETAAMGYAIFRADERDYQAPQRGDQRRGLTPLSGALQAMRANIWRLPPGVRGGRHIEHVQEELFVVLEGTATLLVGDPPERVELPPGSVAVVETETARQLRNESDAEAVVLIVGAPPEQGRAEHLPDID